MPPSDINIEVTHKGSPLGLDPHLLSRDALAPEVTITREAIGPEVTITKEQVANQSNFNHYYDICKKN